MEIKTGKGTIPLVVLLAIWSVSAISSLPGLAVSPVLGDLNRIFPKATDLEIQMLTSLPSLLIIPFVLLSGRLSVGPHRLRILALGLLLFFLSGVACLFARSMGMLIVISCLLGIGAGMVIPFSTGLVVDYFTGDCRVRQLGYSSAINNLTLVLATALTGYLADVDWHLPFLVYTLPGVSLLLVGALRRCRPVPEPARSIQLQHKTIDRTKLVGLMGLYFFITYAVLVVTFYMSFLIDDYRIESSFSGVVISLFFLAIMLPGFFIGRIIARLKQLCELRLAPVDRRGALLYRPVPRPCADRARGAARGTGLRRDAARHLRQGRDDRPAPLGDVGPVVRHGDELPGRDGLPLCGRLPPTSVSCAGRPLPVFAQRAADAHPRRGRRPAAQPFHARTGCFLL